MSRPHLAATVAVAVLVTATLPTGGRLFAAAMLVWAGVVLVAVAELLGGARHRPLVPAAAVAALGVPVSVLVVGSTTWERLPLILAAMLLVAFVIALIAPRRDVTTILSMTALAALLTGLGSAGVLVLRSASAGFRWTLGLLLLTAVPLAAAAVAERAGGVSTALPVRVVSAGAIGGALLLALDTPFGLVVTVVLTAVGLGAGWAAEALTVALPGASGRGVDQPPVLAALLAPLLAAPVAAFVALATSA